MSFSRVWLLATIPLFVVGVFGVIRLAMGLVRFTREAIVASLPVVPEQSVVLPTAGDYSVLTQGKLGERGLGDLRFAVFAEGGGELRLSPVLVRSQATSLDGNVRLELFSFPAQAGRHVLRVIGIDPTREYSHNRVVIARSGRGQLAVRIVALVLTSVVTLVSLVASALLLAGRIQRG
jgi:hypothetical protein